MMARSWFSALSGAIGSSFVRDRFTQITGFESSVESAGGCVILGDMPASHISCEGASEGGAQLVSGWTLAGHRARWRWRGWIWGRSVEILGQKTLAGRSFSATLVAAVGELLAEHGLEARGNLRAIVVVYGPGSFTGVRVGLSAVKGLAEPGKIPVAGGLAAGGACEEGRVRVRRLDAHRHEVFLRLGRAARFARNAGGGRGTGGDRNKPAGLPI